MSLTDSAIVGPSKTETKLDWFRRTFVALYETRQHWKSDQASSLTEEADRPGWYFDWRPVIQYLAPEILVVMSDDVRDRNVDIVIPTYLIITTEGDWITVDVDQLYRESTDWVAAPTGNAYEHALVTMETSISSVEEQRRGEVMRHIRAIRRILRLTT
jgi:hypothetical protein